MDPRNLLRNRIDALAQELDRAGQAIQAEKIEPTLRKRVEARFANDVATQQAKLKVVRGDVDADVALDQCWDAFAIEQKACRDLFRECLVVVQGALLRSAALDNGLCPIADALLRGLGQRSAVGWDRFTILGEEALIVPLADIIRLRFPDLTVWSLPVAAHEFGHFVERDLTVVDKDNVARAPVQEILSNEGAREDRHRNWLREHFADLYATWTVGPAYAWACIHLGF